MSHAALFSKWFSIVDGVLQEIPVVKNKVAGKAALIYKLYNYKAPVGRMV
jgi:hypothetical protein